MMTTRHSFGMQHSVAARGIKHCAQVAALAAVMALGPSSSWALPWGGPPPVELDGPVELSSAVKRRLVQINSAMGVGSASRLELRLTAAQSLKVTITAGTYFLYDRDADKDMDPELKLPQNLVVTRTTTTRLRRGEAQTIDLPTACANRGRRTPNAEDRYVLGSAPKALSSLFTCLQQTRFPASGMQIAVWAATSPDFAAQIARKGLPMPVDSSWVCSSMQDEELRERCKQHLHVRRARHAAQAKEQVQAIAFLRRCGVIRADASGSAGAP